MKYRTTTHNNIGLAIWRLKCFYETFVQGSTVGILLNFCAKNPPHRKPKNVMRNFSSTIPTLFVLMVLSCNNVSSNKSELKKTDSLIVPTDSSAIYLTYPSYSESQSTTDELVDKNRSDSIDIQGCSYFLYRFKEPLLNDYGGKKGIYRFTWSRTFDSPICIRLENNNGEIKLVAKALSGKGGYSIGQIAVDTTVSLTQEKWDAFVSLLDKAKFWEMPNNNYELGFDGATWLLESVQNQKYHWVKRWSPDEKSPFGMVCQYLVSISPIPIDPKRIY